VILSLILAPFLHHQSICLSSGWYLTRSFKNSPLLSESSSLTCWGNHTIDTVIKGYNEIVEIVKKKIPNCKITILELPVYSISTYNKVSDTFDNQDTELSKQIFEINKNISDIFLRQTFDRVWPECMPSLYRLKLQ
jgi:hypothetical protein